MFHFPLLVSLITGMFLVVALQNNNCEKKNVCGLYKKSRISEEEKDEDEKLIHGFGFNSHVMKGN